VRVVIDGLPIRGGSIAVVLRQLLDAWTRGAADDELHIVVGTDAGVVAPSKVTVHEIDLGKRRSLGRLRAQATVLPRLCRSLDADVLLAAIPATTLNRLPCPRVVIAHDLRHELRPEQFSTPARLLRRVSHGLGFRQADAIVTVSKRTRDDLLASRRWLAGRVVSPAQLGGDHVDTWPAPVPGQPYAITFGQWGNKNVDLAVDAWKLLQAHRDPPPLVVVGLAESARTNLQRKVEALGLSKIVSLLPWLSNDEFRARFVSASVVVFPSDFEGFGLPALEAMRLGIPLVITPDTALLEVTGGHAAVMEDFSPDALASAVHRAQQATPAQLAAARTHAAAFTWSRTAELVRTTLLEAVERHQQDALTARGAQAAVEDRG
jgi:glycosyltransferase involved in cell wall biosynthesis